MTISEKAETSEQNTTTFRVRNINEGSTLNIAFYRLYNSFQSLLKLDDFRYSIRAGRSVFAGLDLIDEKVFLRDNLEALVSWLQAPNHFPYDIANLSPEQFGKFLAELHAQILEAYKDYPPKPPTKELDRNEQIKELQKRFRSFGANKSLRKAAWKDIRAKLAPIVEDKGKQDEELVDLLFELTSFAYDLGGLYADVYVGERPATEPYAENMRRLQEQKVANENHLIAARARYLDARSARQLLGLGSVIDPKKIYITDRDVLYMADGHVQLKLRLFPGILWNDGWSVLINDTVGLPGGRFLQDGSGEGGILIFVLPRRFADGGLAEKDHKWFRTNVVGENADLGLTANYKEP